MPFPRSLVSVPVSVEPTASLPEAADQKVVLPLTATPLQRTRDLEGPRCGPLDLVPPWNQLRRHAASLHLRSEAAMADLLPTLLSAVLGGSIVFMSAYFTNRQSQSHQAKLQKQQLESDRFGTLLPLRQEALQFIWLILLQARLGISPSSNNQDEYLKLTIWLPTAVQASCLDAIAEIRKCVDDSPEEAQSKIDRALDDVVDYVADHLERV